jgi:transcriptional regulator with XRE-family HTH domain
VTVETRAIEQLAASSGARIGVRGVVLGEFSDQPYLNIVASPTASYLLPDLVPAIRGISVGSSETRQLNGVVVFGDYVRIGGIIRDEDIAEQQRRWSEFAEVAERLAKGVRREPVSPEPTPAAAAAALDEVEVAAEPLRADASVQDIASRIQQLSSMSDAKLADLFRVTRETFNRWRSGAMTNPSVGTRRRLGMALRLLEELAARGVSTSDWLVNPSSVSGTTPYDLLREGRIDEAAYLAAAARAPSAPPDRVRRDEAPLIFEDDDEGWQSFEIEVTGDDS